MKSTSSFLIKLLFVIGTAAFFAEALLSYQARDYSNVAFNVGIAVTLAAILLNTKIVFESYPFTARQIQAWSRAQKVALLLGGLVVASSMLGFWPQ